MGSFYNSVGEEGNDSPRDTTLFYLKWNSLPTQKDGKGVLSRNNQEKLSHPLRLALTSVYQLTTSAEDDDMEERERQEPPWVPFLCILSYSSVKWR